MNHTYLTILILVYLYILSADGASYANTSSVTEECQLVVGVAEYSCAAMMLLVLATCAARGLRSAQGHRHGPGDKAGRKVKPSLKAADYRKHPSSKPKIPHPDCSENLTMYPSSKKNTPHPDSSPPSKKETPVRENMAKSSGRSAVDQQRRRHLAVIENLDRLISLMSEDESDSSSEFLLTKPVCRGNSQDQAFFSWSTSSEESSVPLEAESRKRAELSSRKGTSDELDTPIKKDVIKDRDDYSGAIKKRKGDEKKPQKGTSDELATPAKKDIIKDRDDYSGAIKKRKGDEKKLRKGASDELATPVKKDIIKDRDDYSGAIKKRKGDEKKPQKGTSDELATPVKKDVIKDRDDYSGAIKKRKGDEKKPRKGASDELATPVKKDIIKDRDDYSGAIKKQKGVEKKPQKGASDQLATPIKQDVIKDREDYSGAIKTRKSDEKKRAAEEMSSQAQGEESRKLAEHSPRKGEIVEPETPVKKDIIKDRDDYRRAINKRKSGEKKRAAADMSSQTQCEEVDFAALHNVVCGSHRKATHDAAAPTVPSAQKVTAETQAQCPESSRDLHSGTGQDFGEVGLERAKESSRDSGSETEEADMFCFLHNVPQQPKRIKVKASSTSKSKNTRNRFAQLREEAKNEVTPVTVYSKKNIVSPSKKGYRRDPESEPIKLNKAISSRNVHYVLSTPEEGAVIPHAHYYEELKNKMSPTAMDSTNENSFISNKDLSTEMNQRTQKFDDEWVQEPTKWDLLYSFPHHLRNCESSANKDTDRCQSKSCSCDDIGSLITGSNSSFERVADYILNLKPYERSSIAVEKSQARTVSQLYSPTRTESENVQLLNDVNKDSGARIPENHYNAISTYLHKTNDDCVTVKRRDHCSSAEMGLLDEQQMEEQNSSVRQKGNDDHGATAACHKSPSKAVKTSTTRGNNS